MQEIEQIETAKMFPPTKTDQPIPAEIYPMVEEMTFRAIIKSKEQGYALLRAVQIIVNEMGSEIIISAVNEIEKNPSLIQKAKSYLPYLKMIP